MKKRNNLYYLEITPNVINYMTSHLREGNVSSVDTF